MNKTQKVVAGTAVAALTADTLIGGIGVTMLGGAIGIPAAALAVVAGAVVLCMPDKDATKDSTETHVLVKDHITCSFYINHTDSTGTVYTKQPGMFMAHSVDHDNLQSLRDCYKELLGRGFHKCAA